VFFDFSHFEIRFEVIHRQRVTSYRGVCVVILVRRDGVGNVPMRVLEDVADDASVLSIKVVFVFVVVSRHHRLQIFLECDLRVDEKTTSLVRSIIERRGTTTQKKWWWWWMIFSKIDFEEEYVYRRFQNALPKSVCVCVSIK
jgi:hypothetical protein